MKHKDAVDTFSTSLLMLHFDFCIKQKKQKVKAGLWIFKLSPPTIIMCLMVKIR